MRRWVSKSTVVTLASTAQIVTTHLLTKKLQTNNLFKTSNVTNEIAFTDRVS